MNEAIRRARELVTAEVPFVHLGRDFNGMDCVGALVYAFQHPVDDIPAYSRDPYRGQLDAHLERVFGTPLQVATADRGGNCAQPVDATLLQEADIVSVQYRGPSRHVGIIANHPAISGELSLIHTDLVVGKVVEHRLDDMWLRRIAKVYRK